MSHFRLATLALAFIACTSTQRQTVYDTSIVVASAAVGTTLGGPIGGGVAAGASHLLVRGEEAQAEIEELKEELSDKKDDVEDKFSPLYYGKIIGQWVLFLCSIVLMIKYRNSIIGFLKNG